MNHYGKGIKNLSNRKIFSAIFFVFVPIRCYLDSTQGYVRVFFAHLIFFSLLCTLKQSSHSRSEIPHMKKTLKVLLAVVITPIALFLILTLLLYCPPVQKWAVEKAAQVASEKTGMRITVEQLRLSFPLDLRLQGLKALQPNDSLPGKTAP